MSEVKHTPGPWHLMPDGFAKDGLWSAPTVYATDDDLRYVAVCACADFGNFHTATDNLANASLISAAPDLLKALKKAEVYVAHVNASDIPTIKERFSVLDEISSAIAKAEASHER